MHQNDPTELLEVFDAGGRPTGRGRPRAAIHLSGDWHQAFHCWIVRHAGREVVLQKRALAKDTFPGCWDAAAAGHWRMGETAEEAAREIQEELGLHVSFADLAYRGRERSARRFPNGLIDREFHQVYVLVSDRPLDEYRPDPREVIGLGAFAVHELLAVLAHKQPSLAPIEAYAVAPDGQLWSETHLQVTRADLVPYSVSRVRRMLGRARQR